MSGETEVMRVTHMDYLPALTFVHEACDTREEVICDSKYVRRKFSVDPTVYEPEDMYLPIGIQYPRCPLCGRKMKYLLEGDYPIVYIFGRNEKNDRKIVEVDDVEVAFWIKESELPVVTDMKAPRRCRIKSITEEGQGYDITRENAVKITCYHPMDVHSFGQTPPSLRDAFGGTSQADVRFEDKAFADLQIKHFIRVPKGKTRVKSSEIEPVNELPKGISVIPHWLVYDLETEYRAGIERAKKGEAIIYSAACYSSYANSFMVFYHHPTYREAAETVKERMREKLYGYVYTKYCPKCHTPYPDGSGGKCHECNVVLTSLEQRNPQFSNLLMHAPIYVVPSTTETRMLQAFLGTMKNAKVDIMGGHNSKYFDDEVLSRRVKRLLKRNAPVRMTSKEGIFGVHPFDFMEAWKYTKRSKSLPTHLDYVGETELGAYKYDYDDNIDYLWKHDIVTLITYCLIDTALVVGYNLKYRPT